VVIIRTDDRDLIFSQYLSNSSGQCCFSGGAITDYAKDNGAISHGSSYDLAWLMYLTPDWFNSMGQGIR
jgi:hypothetical protein